MSASVSILQEWGHLNKHIVDDLFDKDMVPIKTIDGSHIDVDAFYNGYYWIIIHPCAYDIIESVHANYSNKGYTSKCITAHKIVPIHVSIIHTLSYWYYN